MKSKAQRESFVRWQDNTNTQLGYVANLILGFATASLAFTLTLLRDEHFILEGWAKRFFSISVGAVSLSIFFGIWCAINRLRDFRATAQIARNRDRLSETELEQRRADVRELDECTWLLFKIQIVTFGIGLASLTIAFFIIYHARLI